MTQAGTPRFQWAIGVWVGLLAIPSTLDWRLRDVTHASRNGLMGIVDAAVAGR